MFRALIRQTSQSDREENFEVEQIESAKDKTKNAEKWTLGVLALPIALLAFGFCAGAALRRVVEPAHNLTLVISSSDSKQEAPYSNEECPRPIVEPDGERAQLINARR